MTNIDKEPKLYTLHSQKGGVGKTSFAIAIAGLESIIENKNVVIIDADLTGTSLIDIEGFYSNQKVKYFNELILSTPHEFLKYTSTKRKYKNKPDINKLTDLCIQYPDSEFKKIKFIPASPILSDILKIIPFISQEDYLHFFRHRLEDIICALIKNCKFDVIIIDHPPGLFGISYASLNMILEIDYMNKEMEDLKINKRTMLITTSEPNDYKALFPSFFQFLKKRLNIQKNYSNSDKQEDLEKIIKFLKPVVNKGQSKPFDPVKIWENIFKDIKTENFTDNRKNLEMQVLINLLKKIISETGALACPFVDDFNLSNILSTVKRFRNIKSKKYFPTEKGKMERWCIQIATSIGLLNKENIKLGKVNNENNIK